MDQEEHVNDDLTNSLSDAVNAGDLEKVRTLLTSNGRDSVLKDGYFLLCAAINNKHFDVAKLLIASGAMINSDSANGNTPLHWAVLRDNLDLAEELLKRGCDVNPKNEKQKTPLHYACRANPQIAKLMLNYGADVNSQDISGKTPLHIATMHDCFVKELIENGACVDPGSAQDAPLFIACEKGILETCKLLLSKGADVNRKNSYRQETALHAATVRGFEAIVKLLLENGADINVANKFESTPLSFAASGPSLTNFKEILKRKIKMKKRTVQELFCLALENKRMSPNELGDVVKMILGRGAKVNQRLTELYLTPLEVAARRGSAEIVQEILNFHPNLGKTFYEFYVERVLFSKNKMVAKLLLDYALLKEPKNAVKAIAFFVIYAVDVGDLSIVQDLLSYGTEVTKCKRKITALHIAAVKNRENIAQVLIKHGYKVNAKLGKNGKTPLYYAIKKGNLEMAKFLRANGAVVSNQKLIICAVKRKEKKILEAVLEFGADVNCKRASGKSALHYAAVQDSYSNRFIFNKPKKPRLNNVEIVQMLLSQGATVNTLTNDGQSPLHVALKSGNNQVAKLLLEHNADVHGKTKEGSTTLHLAVANCTSEIVRLVLNRGAEVHVLDNQNEYPLHVATRNKNSGAVELLLLCGAKVNARNSKRETALHIAAHVHAIDVAQVLLKRGAKVNMKTYFQKSAIHFAAARGFVDMVTLLCKSGADVNYRDGYLCTAIHKATIHKMGQNIALLVKYGADINAKNKKGLTALHIACKKGPGTVDYLLRSGADVNVTNSENETPLEYAINTMKTCIQENRHEKLYYTGIDVDSEMENCTCEATAKELARHFVKMITSDDKNSFVSNQNMEALNGVGIIPEYHTKCHEEMAIILRSYVNINVSYYDVLKGNVQYMARLMKNKNVKKVYKSRIYKKKFPEFGDEIERQFQKGLAKINLAKKVKRFFNLGDFPELPHPCVDKIIAYLECKDLNVLLDLLYEEDEKAEECYSSSSMELE